MDTISLETNIMTAWDIYKAPNDLVHHRHPAVHSSLCLASPAEVVYHIGKHEGVAVSSGDLAALR